MRRQSLRTSPWARQRPRTSARLTRAGRAAFERHVAALQQIVARSGATILASHAPRGR